MMDGGDTSAVLQRSRSRVKQVERRCASRFDKGEMPESEIDIVQYYRLEAEESLVRAKAEIGEGPNNASNKD